MSINNAAYKKFNQIFNINLISLYDFPFGQWLQFCGRGEIQDTLQNKTHNFLKPH